MSLNVSQIPLGPYAENGYVVRTAPDAAEAVVVDPGWPGSYSEFEDVLGDSRVAAILITHGDIDHIGGVSEAAERTGAPVHMPAEEAERLRRINEFLPVGVDAISFDGYEPEILLEGTEVLELAGIGFETLRVPGHTEAHVAFAADGCLFSGDVLFAGSVGRTDRPNGDWETLLASIRMLAERFPPETVVYPGHGPETTLGHELATNPFLAELRAAPR